MKKRYVVIMAGGKGERFWPQSRLKRPKHLLPIVGEKPMLAQTLDRLEGLVPLEHVFIITNAEQRPAVLEVCPQLEPENVVGEPVGRDTAAAVGLATILVKREEADAAFAMLPADAVIHDVAGFRGVMEAAFEAAEREEAFVTVGIEPTYPATGYGYVEQGEERFHASGRAVYQVSRFVEKPDLDTAQGYLDAGNFYWNAGMFIWRVSPIASALAAHTPDLWNALGAIEQGLAAGEDLQRLLEEHYPNLQKISIDYAVMEKAENVLMVESAFDWDDVGEWPAVARHHKVDSAGNCNKGEVIVEGGEGNIVINEGGHLTALIGVSDLIVVQTPEATLVCPKDRAQEIKKLVKRISAEEKYSHLV